MAFTQLKPHQNTVAEGEAVNYEPLVLGPRRILEPRRKLIRLAAIAGVLLFAEWGLFWVLFCLPVQKPPSTLTPGGVHVRLRSSESAGPPTTDTTADSQLRDLQSRLTSQQDKTPSAETPSTRADLDSLFGSPRPAEQTTKAQFSQAAASGGGIKASEQLGPGQGLADVDLGAAASMPIRPNHLAPQGGNLIQQIEPCLGRRLAVSVDIMIKLDQLGHLTATPKAIRLLGAPVDQARFIAETLAAGAVVACAPYKQAAGSFQVTLPSQD